MSSSLPIGAVQTKGAVLEIANQPPGRPYYPPQRDLCLLQMTGLSVPPLGPVRINRQREARSHGDHLTAIVTNHGGQLGASEPLTWGGRSPRGSHPSRGTRLCGARAPASM